MSTATTTDTTASANSTKKDRSGMLVAIICVLALLLAGTVGALIAENDIWMKTKEFMLAPRYELSNFDAFIAVVLVFGLTMAYNTIRSNRKAKRNG